jgi:diguanylate cyclase (GGDEF)-like protein/PAS domain S-box-containing protein
MSVSSSPPSGTTETWGVHLLPVAEDADRELPGSAAGLMLEAIGQAVIAVDLLGRIQYWNRAAGELYGHAAQEVVGRPLIEVIAPPGDEHLLVEWVARLHAGDSFAGDWRLRTKAGTIFTAHVTLTTVLDENGVVVGSVGVSYDVSSQREVEQRARRPAAIVDGWDDAIIEAGPDGLIRSANPAVERVFGYAPNDLIGRNVAVLIPDERAAEIVERVESLLAGRHVGVISTQRHRKDGSLIDTALRLTPVRDESGAIVGVSGTTRDLTAEMQARTALEASERRYRARFDQSDIPQAFADLQGHLVNVNDALCRLLGRGRQEIEGLPLHSLSHPTDSGAAYGRLEAVLDGQLDVDSWERVLADGDGRPLPVLVHVALMREADGTPDAVAAFVQDVSALRQAESALARREAKFAAFAVRASEWVLVMDASGTLLYVSPSVSRLLDLDPVAVTGRSGWDLVHPEDLADAKRVFDAVLGVPCSSQTVVFRMLAADGQWHWVEQDFTNRMDDADIGGLVCNGRDVTSRVLAEQALRESEARYRSIAETAQEGIWAAEPSGRTLFANRKLADILGLPLQTIYQRPVSALLGPHDPVFAANMFRNPGSRGPEEFELSYPHPDGTARILHLSVSPLRDDSGAVGSLAMIADVTEARRVEDELRHRALHDDLTGLANRSLLTDRLEQAVGRLARQTAGSVAVLFADIDQFKLVNDSWGHAAGDELLVSVGARLVGALRQGDSVARFGGDEFVVVCEDTDEEQARELADHLMAALAAPFDLDGQRVYVGASIGIAVSPPQTASDLLRFADAAMYHAKTAGRGRTHVFDAALADESADRLELSNDLRDALRRDELALHYQPIIELATGRVLGVEALARWQHPTRGPVSPARFVGVAELTGVANSLDRWAVERACRDYEELRDTFGGQPRIAVNISAGHLADPDFEGMVLAAAAAHCVIAGGLELEITENVLMADPVLAGALLQRLRDSGVESSIDDFGTGYSSLAYLGRLPVSTLKVDRAFIERITEDPDALAITASIVDLARTMRMNSVAEGVETVEQAALLQSLGCTAAQGFLWSPAVPPAELIAVLGALPEGRFDVPSLSDGSPRPTRAAHDRVTDEHGLQRLMRLHRDGASLTTIAAALNTEGYRTPGRLRWHRASVARVISKVAYPDLWSAPKP